MRIKILHAIPSLLGGGAERQLVNVASNTSLTEFSHSVCVFGDASFFAPQLISKDLTVNALGETRERRWFKYAAFLRAQIAKEKPDIIHSWLFDANIASRLAVGKSSFAPKIITSLQSPDYEPETIRAGQWNPRKVRILKAFDKLTARIARPTFAACSQFVADSYKRELGIADERMSVIYNSVDPQTLSSTPEDAAKIRQELNISPDEFVFISVGRLDAAKNHQLQLKAFALTQNKIQAKLLIIGVGRLESELKKLAETLQISERVHFLGRRSDIGSCLQAADAFVFSTLFEGLPVAVLEAMSVGLPCVASDIAVMREVIEDQKNGLLINPHDASQMADAMIKLYENKGLRKDLGQRAEQHTAAKFSSSVTTTQWEELYRRLAAKYHIQNAR